MAAQHMCPASSASFTIAPSLMGDYTSIALIFVIHSTSFCDCIEAGSVVFHLDDTVEHASMQIMAQAMLPIMKATQLLPGEDLVNIGY
jgi:hypothetical protein